MSSKIDLKKIPADEQEKILKLLKERANDEDRVDFLYNKQTEDPEDYLLGKRVDDITKVSLIDDVNRQTTSTEVEGTLLERRAKIDMEAKMREDPLYLIKQKEFEQKKQLVQNPVKMKRLQKLLAKQEKQKDKKEKKRKHKKRKKSNNSDSDSDSDDELIKKYLSIVQSKQDDVNQIATDEPKESPPSPKTETRKHSPEKPPKHDSRRNMSRKHSDQRNSSPQSHDRSQHHHRNRDRSPQQPSRNRDRSPQQPSRNRDRSPQQPSRNRDRSPQQPSRNRDRSPQQPSKIRDRSSLQPSRNRDRSPQQPSRNRDRSPQQPSRNRDRSPQHPSRNRDRSPQHPSRNRDRSPQQPSRKRDRSPQQSSKSRPVNNRDRPSKPASKRSAEEMERLRREMMGDAKCRDEERTARVAAHRAEVEKEDAQSKRQEAADEEPRNLGKDRTFIRSMLLGHAGDASVEEQVRRNVHKVQRGGRSMDSNAYRK